MALARLLFVTGKGGTGKSTVAAALADALSHKRPTVLADLDPRMSAAAMLLGAPLAGGAGARISPVLEVVALTARAELEAFMRRIVPVAAISRRMLGSRTFGYVTAALPGLEAFLLLERLRIMAGDAALEDRQVVVDAPASGSALELLAVASAVKGIAPAGSLNRIAHSVESFVRDPARFGVILTVTPEELAIREALELAAALREHLGVATVAAIMNRMPAPLFTRADLDAIAPLRAHHHLAVRRELERSAAHRARREFARAGVPMIELAALYRPAMGRAEITALGGVLAAELPAR
ncbi:MAG TPA: ArsA-related P-loop ATPase [Candidatus Binataceae bacterium]|nr:ArsA-related P-loop ATPase [Candidatus Binataceae bacterium]